MSNALEIIKQHNRGTHTFKDGLVVGFHYPDMEDYILDGRLPELAAAVTAHANGSEPTEEEAQATIAEHPDEFAQQLKTMRRVVSDMLDTVGGVPIPDADRAAIVTELGVEKRHTLFQIANRQLTPSSNGSGSGEA